MFEILMAGNRKVAEGLLLVVLSYTLHNVKPAAFSFLTMDRAAENPAYVPPSAGQAAYLDRLLKAKNPASSFRLVDVGKDYGRLLAHTVADCGIYTPYTLLRLLADRLPALQGKVLYLDTDIVIAHDLTDLFATDLAGCEFAAARDILGRVFIYPNYQNAGVMLLDLDRIRQTGLFARCRRLLAAERLPFPDQDALNKLVGKRKFLPPRYNTQGRPHRDTVIKHFPKTIRFFPWFHTLNIKPWMIDRVHDTLHIHDYDRELEAFAARRDVFLGL